MKKLILFLLLTPSLLFSQQVVRGKVVDKESQFPLPGVNIQFINTEFEKGVASDINGTFKMEDVPLGRHQLKFSFIGYQPLVQTIVVNSGIK